MRAHDRGVHVAASLRRDLAQFAAVAQRVGAAEKARLPVIAALDRALRRAGKFDAAWAGYGCSVKLDCVQAGRRSGFESGGRGMGVSVVGLTDTMQACFKPAAWGNAAP